MRLIVEHLGDGRSDGEQTLEYALEREDRLKKWRHQHDPLSYCTGVESIYRDRLDQVVVSFEDGDEIRLPNVKVVSLRGDD